jgi:hypothetical protein
LEFRFIELERIVHCALDLPARSAERGNAVRRAGNCAAACHGHRVAGAAGEAEFAPDFAQQMEAWAKVSAQAQAKLIAIGGTETDRERVKAALEAEPKTGWANCGLC